MLNLTPQERKIILFFACLVFFGIGINLLQKKYPPLKAAINLDADFGRINLNTADEALLMSVPGVGKKIAGRIIAHRLQERFLCVEELKAIKGVTDTKYQKLQSYFFVK
ncbi:MAG: helix-hairpin-helix domain-containing protein [Candidatus Omnitrophica bacterium]|nr:helix-hairpin-helix domain-containing protein [Candidatus Omnitrophota bacterium]